MHPVESLSHKPCFVRLQTAYEMPPCPKTKLIHFCDTLANVVLAEVGQARSQSCAYRLRAMRLAHGQNPHIEGRQSLTFGCSGNSYSNDRQPSRDFHFFHRQHRTFRNVLDPAANRYGRNRSHGVAKAVLIAANTNAIMNAASGL